LTGLNVLRSEHDSLHSRGADLAEGRTYISDGEYRKMKTGTLPTLLIVVASVESGSPAPITT
jgi:hypothetical protein